jgi:hypothetical protein
MGRAYMRGEEIPLSVLTDLSNRYENGSSSRVIQLIGIAQHPVPSVRFELDGRLSKASPMLAAGTVDPATLVAR